jgi:ATP-dependent helicase Lhr and Lhr-like helicase
VLVATNVNDLVETTVTAKLVREGALDPIRIPEKPFDVLAQQIVGIVALEPIPVDEIFWLVRRAFPFRDLSRREFDRVLSYLEGGGASLAKQCSNLFGKIKIDHAVVSLAHPRVARDLLANIGTIVSEGSVDVLLKQRRLGSVEENFIKQLNVGDRFVLAGRVVKLTDTGVNEVFVERADGQLPTVPRWNAAKMPLTSGVARGVRKLRGELARRLKEEVEDSHPGYHDTYASGTANSIQQVGGPYALTARRPAFRYAADWLVENYHISSANAEAIVEQFQAQMRISEIPSGTEMLVELYRDGERLNYFFHSLI